MKRDCNTCKKNKEQAFNQCGYIDKDKRFKSKIDFPALKNPYFYIEACPLWYLNTYRNLYAKYNRMRASSLDISSLKFGERILFDTFNWYIPLKQEYLYNKNKAKNGN